MARRSKERFWRQVVRRWPRSGLTIRAFCVAESVSQASFNLWRRELERRDQEATVAKPRFFPVRVCADQDRTPSADKDKTSGLPAIDVVLVNGRHLRVPAGFDPAMLRQLLAIAEESHAC